MSHSYKKLPTEDPFSATEESIILHPSSESITDTAPTSPLPPATNHTSLIYRDKDLKGTYVIDNTLPVPAFLLTSGDPLAPKLKPNAKFGTIDGAIDLVLHLRGKGVVQVEVESVVEKSSDNVLKVAIATRDPLVKLKLTVNSKGCSTFISLPSSFRGVVEGGSTSGEVVFSPRLLPLTTTYAINQANPKEGRYLIGEGSTEIGGDVLIVTLEGEGKRNITIQRYDEKDLGEYYRKKTRRAAERLRELEESRIKKDESDTKLGAIIILAFVFLIGLGIWCLVRHLDQ